MRLLITTPTALVTDRDDVSHVRAEDDSGSFGILEGHADFLTVLNVSVLRWRTKTNHTYYCALRRGVMTVRGGHNVMVATRQAVLGTDIEELEGAVLARFRAASEEESIGRAESARLEMTAIRRIIRYLRPTGVSILRNGR